MNESLVLLNQMQQRNIETSYEQQMNNLNNLLYLQEQPPIVNQQYYHIIQSPSKTSFQYLDANGRDLRNTSKMYSHRLEATSNQVNFNASMNTYAISWQNPSARYFQCLDTNQLELQNRISIQSEVSSNQAIVTANDIILSSQSPGTGTLEYVDEIDSENHLNKIAHQMEAFSHQVNLAANAIIPSSESLGNRSFLYLDANELDLQNPLNEIKYHLPASGNQVILADNTIASSSKSPGKRSFQYLDINEVDSYNPLNKISRQLEAFSSSRSPGKRSFQYLGIDEVDLQKPLNKISHQMEASSNQANITTNTIISSSKSPSKRPFQYLDRDEVDLQKCFNKNPAELEASLNQDKNAIISSSQSPGKRSFQYVDENETDLQNPLKRILHQFEASSNQAVGVAPSNTNGLLSDSSPKKHFIYSSSDQKQILVKAPSSALSEVRDLLSTEEKDYFKSLFDRKLADLMENNDNSFTSPTKRSFLNECIRQIYIINGKASELPMLPSPIVYNKSQIWSIINEIIVPKSSPSKEFSIQRIRKQLFRESKIKTRKNIKPKKIVDKAEEIHYFKAIRCDLGVKRIRRNFLNEARQNILENSAYLSPQTQSVHLPLQFLPQQLYSIYYQPSANEEVLNLTSKECKLQSNQNATSVANNTSTYYPYQENAIENLQMQAPYLISHPVQKLEEDVLIDDRFNQNILSYNKALEESVRSIYYMKALLNLMVDHEDNLYM